MTRSEIEQKLKDIICNQLNVDEEQVHANSSLIEDLGCDSLDMVELLMAIEETFRDQLSEGEIPESHAERLSTYGDLVEYLASGGKTLPSIQQ